MDVAQQIEREEGRVHAAYPDPLTHAEPWTIGVGHTGPEVHRGLVWTDEQIDEALERDIGTAKHDCLQRWPWFATLDEPRQAVLIGMVFQMGVGRVLKFVDTLHAIESGRFAHAAECMRQSVWARQTPKRAARMAHQLETGAWQ